MLSIANVKKINRMIADEMRTASSICSSHNERLEAIYRATALRELLDDRPEVQKGPRTHPDRVVRTMDLTRVPMQHIPTFR